MKLADVTTKLLAARRALTEVADAVAAAERENPVLPTTTAEIEAALVEYAAAEADSDGHFARFSGEASRPRHESRASKEDWTRVCERIRVARNRLIAIGQAIATRRAPDRTERAPTTMTPALAAGEENRP